VKGGFERDLVRVQLLRLLLQPSAERVDQVLEVLLDTIRPVDKVAQLVAKRAVQLLALRHTGLHRLLRAQQVVLQTADRVRLHRAEFRRLVGRGAIQRFQLLATPVRTNDTISTGTRGLVW